MSQQSCSKKKSSDHGCFHVQYQSPHDSYISPVLENYNVASSLDINASSPMTTCIVYTQPRCVSVESTSVQQTPPKQEMAQTTVLYHEEDYYTAQNKACLESTKELNVVMPEMIVMEKPPLGSVNISKQSLSSSLTPEYDVPTTDKTCSSTTTPDSPTTTPDSPSNTRRDQRRSLTG